MKIKNRRKYYEIDLSFNPRIAIIILIAAINLAINLHFFPIRNNVWWDEAEYLSFAKHLVYNTPYVLWDGRAILYPLMLAAWNIFGTSLSYMKVLTLIISLITAVMTYLSLEKYFSKKVAIVSSLLFVSSKLFIAFSQRMLTDLPSLMFVLFALYFFKDKKKLSAIFLGLAAATRFTSVLIIPAMIVHDWLDRKRKIKDYKWMLWFFAGYSPMMLYDLAKFGSPLHSPIKFLFFNTHASYNNKYGALQYVYDLPYMFDWATLFFLAIGLTSFTLLIKKKSYAMIFTYIVISFALFSVITDVKDDRFILPITPFIFVIASKGLLALINSFKMKKNYKYAIIAAVLIFILYQNIEVLNKYIINVSQAYDSVRLAGEFLKTHSLKDEIIITNAPPQITYFSERKTEGFPRTIEALESELMNDSRKNIIVLDSYENMPSYYTKFINNSKYLLANEFKDSNKGSVAVIWFNKTLYNLSLSENQQN